MGTNSVFLPKIKHHDLKAAVTALRVTGPARSTMLTAARFQELAALPSCCEPTKVPVEDVYEEYNMCQSCLHDCKMFKESKCGFDVLKEQCLPDVLMEGCAECEGKGCAQVIEFLNENEALNATAEGGDNITRLEIFTELVWSHAQEEAVREKHLLCPFFLFGNVHSASFLGGKQSVNVLRCRESDALTIKPLRVANSLTQNRFEQEKNLPNLRECINKAATVGESCAVLSARLPPVFTTFLLLNPSTSRSSSTCAGVHQGGSGGRWVVG